MTEPQTFLDGRVTLHAGDCLAVMAKLEPNSIDACVTDPPYHLTSIVKQFGGVSAAPAKHGTDGAFARASRGFMGQQWDGGDIAFRPETWAEVLRVLKPGGHVVAFNHSRTWHRMACAIEDAGFEIRDSILDLYTTGPAWESFIASLNEAQIDGLGRALASADGGLLAWLYGTGFPKSHDVAKAITRTPGAEKVLEIKLWLAARFDECGKGRARINRECGFTASDYLKTEPGNDAGGRATWHTLLPIGEKWVRLREVVGFGPDYDDEIARLAAITGRRAQRAATGDVFGAYAGEVKDYDLTSAARAWQGFGTALKPAFEPIVLARKPLAEGTVARQVLATGTGAINVDGCRVPFLDDADKASAFPGVTSHKRVAVTNAADETDRAEFKAERNEIGRFPANVVHDGSDEIVEAFPAGGGGDKRGKCAGTRPGGFGNVGADRGAGEPCGQTYADSGSAARFFYSAKASKADRRGSKHPTVKPLDLMQWLVRLVTPKGAVVLDPFAGSGTTGEAAFREGMRAVLIEREPAYQADIAKRMDLAANPSKRSVVAKTKGNIIRAEDTPLFGADEFDFGGAAK